MERQSLLVCTQHLSYHLPCLLLSSDGYYQLCKDYSSDAGSFVWFSQSLVPNKPTTYVVVQAVDRPKTLIYDCATASTAMLLRPFVIDAFLLDDSVQRMSDAMLHPRYQFLEDVSILS
jgi:hypothetical protein